MSAELEAGLLALRVRRLSRELAFYFRANESIQYLSFVEAHVMESIIGNPGVTLGELAKQVRIKKSNLSSAVSVLTERGFIRREPSAVDARLVHLYATDKAEANLQRLMRFWGRSVIRQLDEEELASLPEMARLIEKISDSLASLEIEPD